ncbi:MAG: hypothetical protein ACYCYF_12330 [Anaerolineae bacterium]
MTQGLRLVMRLTRGGAKLALPLLLLPVVFASPIRAQEGANQAGLVVVHGDGRVTTRCVRFDEAQISGLTLLQRSGIVFTASTGPMGATICSLNGEGCPTSDCWCECKGTPCAYWIYFQRNADGSWAYAPLGAALRQLGNGDVDGWMWGDTTSLPPAMSFEAICGTEPSQSPATPVPTEASTIAATLAPTTTPVPAPAVTAGPTATTKALDPTQTPETSATPAASPTAVPATPSATPVPPSPEPPLPTALVPTARPDDQPADAEAPISEPSSSSGYVAFAVILAAVGGVSLFLRHRRREG